jgi:WD40 repeat protein
MRGLVCSEQSVLSPPRLLMPVEVRAPRLEPCRCGVASRRSITPLAEIMPDRCTLEYERVVAQMGAWLPYRRALSLLADFFPLDDDAPKVETTRQGQSRSCRAQWPVLSASFSPDDQWIVTGSPDVTARIRYCAAEGGILLTPEERGVTLRRIAMNVTCSNGIGRASCHCPEP